MLGYSQRARLTNVWVVNQRLWSSSFFVQDDWKVTNALTLNIGVRYDFTTPPYEADNRLANFDPAADGGAGGLVFASDGSLEDRALVRPDKNNLAPRIGAVYQLDDRTIIRGGYGVFYNQFERIGSEDQLALNPPGLRNIDISAASGSTTPVLLMRDGFPPDFLDRLVLGNLMLRAADPDAPRTRVQQFGAGLERQLGNDFVVSVDVVGSLTSNLAVLRNLNQPLPGTRDANGSLPFPTFGSNLQWREMTGNGNYKGVDLGFEKRFSQGYSYRVSYTLGEARDEAPEHLNASSGRPQNGRDLAAWEGPSDFDIRNRLAANFIAELPFGEGKAMMQDGVGSKILGGWLLSGIFSARSGRPITVYQGTNNVGPGAEGLPNLIGDPEGPQTVDQWFNKAAFELVPSGQFGNAGRNIVRGPGWVTLDLSVQRRIDFTSRVNTTLRWDIFNVFDRANFGNPERNIASASAAVISTLAGDPRVMQFSVRVAF
jgi:TonB dependent receptor